MKILLFYCVVRSVFLNNVVRSALDNTCCRNEGEFCLLLKFRYCECSAVAHCGLNLSKRNSNIVFKASCVRNIGIDAFLEGELLVAAEVISLPVSGTIGAFAPIFLIIGAASQSRVTVTVLTCYPSPSLTVLLFEQPASPTQIIDNVRINASSFFVF